VRDNQIILDLFEMDAASNRGIDDAKALMDKVAVPPSVEGRRKVYIIDEVHMLSREAFNALLKTLEEPPPYAVFVLATTDAHKVLPTVVSRCHRFDFRRVGPSDIARRLFYVADKENVQLEDKAAQLIARVADGGLRDALSLLEQVIAFSQDNVREDDVRLVLGSVSRELLQKLMDSLAERDVSLALSSIETAGEEGVSFGQLARDLIAYARDGLLLMMGAAVAAEGDERARMAEHARKVGKARLLLFIESLRAAEKEMREATDHRLLLELALVRATTDFSSEAAPAREPSREQVLAPRPVERPAQAPAQPREVLAPRVAPLSIVQAPQEEPRHEQVLARAVEAPEAPAAEVEDEAVEPAPIEGAEAEAVEETPPQVLEMPVLEVPTAPDEPPLDESQADETHATSVADYAAPRVEHVEESPAVPAVDEVPPRPPSTPKRGRRIHNLEEFQELWPAVLTRIKKKIGVTAVAYLHDAHAVELSEKDAVIEFTKEFHFEKACEAAKRLPFEQVLNECLATPHALKFRLAARKPKAAPAPEPEASGDDDDDDDEADIFRYAQDIFAGQIVGRSGS
jgi:DNA polymerase-3 subunit gamma/tau